MKRAVVRGSGPNGLAKGASLKPAKARHARTLPLKVGADASCMATGLRDHGRLKARHGSLPRALSTDDGVEMVRYINAELRRITYELKRVEGL